MIYYGQEIEINFLKPSEVLPYYSYNPNISNFTFTAEFEGNNSVIEDMQIITLDANNNPTFIPLTYDETKGLFAGNHKFYADNAPVIIDVQYNVTDEKVIFGADDMRGLYSMNEVTEMPDEPFDFGEPTDEDKKYADDLMSLSDEEFIQAVKDFAGKIDSYNPDQYKEQAENDYGIGGESTVITDCSAYNESEMESIGFTKIELDDGSVIYSKTTEEEIITVDFKENRTETFTIPEEIQPQFAELLEFEAKIAVLNAGAAQFLASADSSDINVILQQLKDIINKIKDAAENVNKLLTGISELLEEMLDNTLALKARIETDISFFKQREYAFFKNGNVMGRAADKDRKSVV
jgi:hypothetical protein